MSKEKKKTSYMQPSYDWYTNVHDNVLTYQPSSRKKDKRK